MTQILKDLIIKEIQMHQRKLSSDGVHFCTPVLTNPLLSVDDLYQVLKGIREMVFPT